MISCAICERTVACGVAACAGACSTSSWGRATAWKCTLPLSVWRWPKASQSACTLTPSWRVGRAAISAVCVGACQAETVSQSEPTEPEEKLLMPSRIKPLLVSLAVTRLSRGFKALPQNRRSSTVRVSRRRCCCALPYSCRPASCKWWKPKTCASALSARARMRITWYTRGHDAPWPPNSTGIDKVSKPDSRSHSRSCAAWPPAWSRAFAVSARRAASFVAMRMASCKGSGTGDWGREAWSKALDMSDIPERR